MLLLDKDSHALLTYLLDLEQPETIMSISKKIGQSRRKIYYSLEKLNEALPEQTGPISSIPRVGVYLNQAQKLACQLLLEEMDDYSYIMSMEERTQLLLIYILVSPERVTLERMMQLTDVSRNTTLNDINDIRDRLSRDYCYLPLVVTKSQGYFINCHLLDKIQYIYSLLFTIFTSSNESFMAILEKKIQDITQDIVFVSPDNLDPLLQIFRDLRKTWGKEMYDSDLTLMLRMLPYILLAYRNSQLSQDDREDVIRELALVRKRMEFQVAKEISRYLEKHFDLQLDDIEVSLIGLLLLSSRKNYDSHTNTLDFKDIEEAIGSFLKKFEETTQFQITQRSDLAKRLLIHCKALMFRKTYRILSRNPLTQQIKEKYSSLFEATASCLDVLEKAWLIQLTDDDIAHIVIHLGGALRSMENQRQPGRVCLVCDDGVAIQRLLIKQLEHHFPGVRVESVFTTEQFRSVEDILDVDALIQTSDSLETNLPSIQVSPILSHEDILAINRILLHPHPLTEININQELDVLIDRYLANDEKRSLFKQHLNDLIQTYLTTKIRIE